MGFWKLGKRSESTSVGVPGCFERHLQRRRQNPLFPADRQDVSHSDIQHAQQRDKEERVALRSRILEVLRPLMEGPDLVDGGTAVDLLQEVHKLIELVHQSDQGLEREGAALMQGYQSLSESIRLVRGP